MQLHTKNNTNIYTNVYLKYFFSSILNEMFKAIELFPSNIISIYI